MQDGARPIRSGTGAHLTSGATAIAVGRTAVKQAVLERFPGGPRHLSGSQPPSRGRPMQDDARPIRPGTGATDEISTNMHGGTPRLVVGERICWRVPVILSMPPTGDRGEVGAIDVDVETGQLIVTHTLIEEIQQRAECLATHCGLRNAECGVRNQKPSPAQRTGARARC